MQPRPLAQALQAERKHAQQYLILALRAGLPPRHTDWPLERLLCRLVAGVQP